MSLTSFLELVKALQIQETLQKLKLFEKRKLLKILWKKAETHLYYMKCIKTPQTYCRNVQKKEETPQLNWVFKNTETPQNFFGNPSK